jgi:hypothetical protein
MIVGLLICASLVGLTASAVCYSLTGSAWLALTVYSVSGPVTVTLVVVARETCGLVRQFLQRTARWSALAGTSDGSRPGLALTDTSKRRPRDPVPGRASERGPLLGRDNQPRATLLRSSAT